MCGIIGIASREPEMDLDVLIKMCDSMIHRGPDDVGLWWSEDRRVGVAHRRLAVIDTSDAGHQPMLTDEAAVVLVFNGEIYNFQELRERLEGLGHRFSSRCDTEVLLKAYLQWGEDCVAHLDGMFAFCVVDQDKKALFLARDRAGEKPLFYWRTPDHLFFASELKALLQHPCVPRQLSRQALNDYLCFGYVPHDRCMIEGVNKLPQGHALRLDLTEWRTHQWAYWQLPKLAVRQEYNQVSSVTLSERLEPLLEASVTRRLVADVPVGVMLSGGLDSSLVTAMAVRSSSRVRTFTISFAGHPLYDEGPYARLVASHFGTDHTELVAEPSSVDILPDLAKQYDEPLADSSMVPMLLVSRLIREHCTVALSGDGGDELFGGYQQYSWLLQQSKVRQMLPNWLRRCVWRSLQRVVPQGLHGRNYLLGFLTPEGRACAQTRVYFDETSRRRLLQNPEDVDGGPEDWLASQADEGRSIVDQATRSDFRSYLVDDLLVKVDRASMLASLEVRAPFLDPQLIEFAFCEVPPDLKATCFRRKHILREMARRLLPAKYDVARKQGFSIPFSDWFQGSWGEYMAEVLDQLPATLFRRDAVDELIRSQRRGRSNTQRLYALVMFELWRSSYRIEV